MNYFCHALPHLHRPHFVAGTAVPDWLSVVDRRVRVRAHQAAPFVESTDALVAEFAAGIVQHHADDQWFHTTRGFVEITQTLAKQFRTALGPSDDYDCAFLGHLLTELLLDAALIARFPAEFEQWCVGLREIPPTFVEDHVNQMARRPVTRLAEFVTAFVSAEILRDYRDDERLFWRLNQVLGRVKLSPLPGSFLAALSPAREFVNHRWQDLLPAEHYPWLTGREAAGG